MEICLKNHFLYTNLKSVYVDQFSASVVSKLWQPTINAMCCEALLKQTGLPCNKIAYNFIGKATELEQV